MSAACFAQTVHVPRLLWLWLRLCLDFRRASASTAHYTLHFGIVAVDTRGATVARFKRCPAALTEVAVKQTVARQTRCVLLEMSAQLLYQLVFAQTFVAAGTSVAVYAVRGFGRLYSSSPASSARSNSSCFLCLLSQDVMLRFGYIKLVA